jgi:hypothetical protein
LNILNRFCKSSYIKFHEKLSSGSRVAPCSQTDRWTDQTKLVVTFQNFSNAPKNAALKLWPKIEINVLHCEELFSRQGSLNHKFNLYTALYERHLFALYCAFCALAVLSFQVFFLHTYSFSFSKIGIWGLQSVASSGN